MAAGDLTDKQAAFVEFYFASGFNATRAAIAAGYSEATARSTGSENLTKPDIRAAIDARFAELADDAEQMRRLLVRELVAILASNLTGLVEWDDSGMRLVPADELTDEQAASLREVSLVIESHEGESGSRTVTRSGVKQHDKVRAADLLARLHGLLQSKLELSGTVGITLGKLHELAGSAEADADAAAD